MGTIINPTTGKPFNQVNPNDQITELRREIVHKLRSRFDAAQTTSQNELHWRNADNLGPDAVADLSVRRLLRNRSRYEWSNNGYLKGISLTMVGDFIGSGPKLQITDKRFNEEQRELIERRFNVHFAKKIKLRQKLWRLRMDKIVAGEGFAIRYYDEGIRHPIKQNWRVYECDQISSNLNRSINGKDSIANEIDGIRFSKTSGEPKEYHLLDSHPGESSFFNFNGYDGKWIPSQQVTHWFRQDRGWLRGIPETTPTLPLWALLRRYTLAVVQNAEIAADFTVLLKSMQTPYSAPFALTGTPGEPTQSNPNDWFDSFPVDRGLMTVLPDRYDLTQLDPKQPVTVYDVFTNALVQEAARPLLVPRNLALGNSGGYNMSSGTLDRQFYRQAINIERFDCEDSTLDPVLYDWWYEAIRSPEYFMDEVNDLVSVWEIGQKFQTLRQDSPEHIWRWDEVPEHSDPVKVAKAIEILHQGGHLSDTDIQEGRFNRSVADHYANLSRQYEWRNRNEPKSPSKQSTKLKKSSSKSNPDDNED